MKKTKKFSGIIALVVIIGFAFIACDDGSSNNIDESKNKSRRKTAGATVAAPKLNSKTHNSIWINAATAPNNGQTVEYGINTTNFAPSTWQDGTSFFNLTADTAYYIFARSKENANYNAGTASTGLQVKTDILKSAGTTVAAPTLNTKTQNSITINAVTNPSNGQTVEYARNTVNSAPSSGWQVGLTFSSLNSNTQYYIFARSRENATHSAGTPSSPLSVTTDPPLPPPDTPSILSVGANSASSIRITWETVPGAAGYRISRSESANGENLPYNATWTQIGTTGATLYTDNNVKGYFDYHYRVVAYNAVGESNYAQTLGRTTRLFYSTLIVGTWFPSSATPGSSNHARQLVFNSNGTLSSGYPIVTNFTYNLVGDIIQFIYGGGVAFEASINITNNVMTFSNLSGIGATSHIGSSPYTKQ